jgi:aminodeoxyfutalosine deaminase
MPYPKIELHIHIEGSVRPTTLLEIARRNGVTLPASTVEELAALYRFRDFDDFIEIWAMTVGALQHADDFRRILVDYAEEAARHGAVYIEGIFAPSQMVLGGTSWEDIFNGYCDGAQEARERYGIEVRLTPDITRGGRAELAMQTARYAVAFRERGIVGLGLGGPEAYFPPEPYAAAFRVARDGGLGSVPHAGEGAGVASIRGALDVLGADRLRHGIRAVEYPALLRELADRGTVLDVCPISNVRLGVVRSLEEHPLPRLVAAGVRCSLATDDPAMFDTDLTREHAAARALGLEPRAFYEAGVTGALCDDATRARLRAIGEAYDWHDAHA